MAKAKPNENEYRRFIGYLILTFLSIFIYLPILWFINLWHDYSVLYGHWIACSAILLVFNIVFYHLKYPRNWLTNLLVLVGVNLTILVLEYLWISMTIG